MNKRDIAEKIFQSFLLNRVLKNVLMPQKKTIRILAYHKVLDSNNRNYKFDNDIISSYKENFIDEIKYLKKNYNIITFEDLLEIEESNKNIPNNLLIITFDDGYADNYDIVYPILKEFGIKATFYLAINYIGTKDIFWWEKLIYIIKNSNVDYLKIDELDIETNQFQKDKYKVIKKMYLNIPKVKNNIRLKVVNELEEKLEISFNNSSINDPHIFPLTWVQVKEMQKGGMEFGSHTLTHPILTSQNEEQIKNEILESKVILEKKLGERVYSISYPIGLEYAYNESIIKYVKMAGYKYATTYISGMNFFPLMNKFELLRIRCERQITLNGFKCMNEFPQIFLRQ